MKETYYCNICFSWELKDNGMHLFSISRPARYLTFHRFSRCVLCLGYNLKNCGHPFCKARTHTFESETERQRGRERVFFILSGCFGCMLIVLVLVMSC